MAAQNRLAAVQSVRYFMPMRKSGGNAPKQNYKWPWFVGAAVVLGFVLAIVWVSFAVKKIERERDFGAPLPNSAPVR